VRRILTTLYFPRRSAWAERVTMLDRSTEPPPRLLRGILRQAGPEDVVVLDGGIGARDLYLDRVAATLLARRRRGPRIVLTDSTWSPTPARRLALRAFDGPRTTYCVLSRSERESFPHNWGVDPDRVVLTPFYWTLPEDDPAPRFGGTGIFAGGDSLRDHETLLAAAARVPAPVTIATRRHAPGPVPDSVSWGPVDPDHFVALLHASAVVAVPLYAGQVRSAGQQTYLNAMVLGKPVVVSDVPGVRDHIVDGETGLIVPPGDADAMAAALARLTDPDNAEEARRMGERARAVVLRDASPDRYVERLLEVVDALPG
jgi:glycosyltransferase involved in cell wall biosynthesis